MHIPRHGPSIAICFFRNALIWLGVCSGVLEKASMGDTENRIRIFHSTELLKVVLPLIVSWICLHIAVQCIYACPFEKIQVF